ncbi:MAG: flagellar biosynthesis protein FlhA [Chromatiaceae bacterium]|nr:flagellar biosynthesis protein FlhA [Chromatiaceae bacterium]
MDATAILNNVKSIGTEGLGAPLILVMMLAMVVIPLPALALDIFFTFNIALSLVVLLVVVYTLKPLEFSVFPSLLLVATLLRLALNVASTRVVLLEGHEGGDAAGKVIEAFGAFVIGGNYAVGLVVFAILVIINFVVVTKGAGRVSEVSARFTLDAMPGKQMAIDADLNAGIIGQEEAKARRQEITVEADFYGSMDGASKFVRGDAVAGILILLINIVGGLAIGMFQHDLNFSTALRYYALLTIGDGLVAQIPSLLLSTSAAIIVTRVASTQDMGGQILSQLLSTPKSLAVAAGVLGLMGVIPGMPNFAFLSLAGLAGAGAWWIYRGKRSKPEEEAPPQVVPEAPPEQRELTWEDVQPVDIIGLEVGYKLIPLVDKNQGGELMKRIKGVRKKLSKELGFLIQPVHIQDNLDLSPTSYRISLHGVVMGEAEIFPDRDLAINSGKVFGKLQGVETQDPAFGLESVWIDHGQRDYAQTLGYTVVDASTVLATHLKEILERNAHELLGHEEVQQLLDQLARSAPKLIEDLVPGKLSLGQILKILKNLLRENVPIRDIRSIAETLAESGGQSQDIGVLTSQARVALSRGIVQQLIGPTEEIPVIVLEQNLERILQKTLHPSNEGGVGLEPGLAEQLQKALLETYHQQERASQQSILLVAASIRAWMANFVRHSVPGMRVLSYQEIPDNRKIKVVANVGRPAD